MANLKTSLTFATPQDPEVLRARIEQLEAQLEDAEITISKIGFCDPTPYEALERYTRKYGSVRDREHKVVR